ncbi:type II toxin-antitoxin system MqsA family antitoxin [Delftia acidovorans]|uniref:type II toxin-antitoxin system MqsA family antitoxin n=1 Tax=Delftia acidovorans TaxID=80866 RepID=UPI000BCCEB08|nr:type II toxin-antitoxin system MqsA family antitoxin [Delftia acidovorans]SOE35313.1 putative zinc finger/helix-turn-helix protein, YgiT family [Delftia acidovorans]
MKCPACGGADLTSGLKVIKSVYKDDTVEVEVSGGHCPACGESVLDRESSARYMAAMSDQRLRVDGEHESNRTFIRTVRVKLGLSQRVAGEIFGGGPNAFSRYERGHTRPPQALLQLFRVLNARPESAQFLDGFKGEVSQGNEAVNIAHEVSGYGYWDESIREIGDLHSLPLGHISLHMTPDDIDLARQKLLDSYAAVNGGLATMLVVEDPSGTPRPLAYGPLRDAIAARGAAAAWGKIRHWSPIPGLFAQPSLYHDYHVSLSEPSDWPEAAEQLKKAPRHG